MLSSGFGKTTFALTSVLSVSPYSAVTSIAYLKYLGTALSKRLGSTKKHFR